MPDESIRASKDFYGRKPPKPTPAPVVVAEVIESTTDSRFSHWRVRWTDEKGQRWESTHACSSRQSAQIIADLLAEGRDLGWVTTTTPTTADNFWSSWVAGDRRRRP